MDNLDRWIDHSRMSDPVGHAAAIADLPFDIGVLNGIIQGVLVHADWLTQYGLDENQLHAASRTTLSVADRLRDILDRDARRLEARRPPHMRSIGTCRDFALMLCAVLRCKGIPSRLRCGFAAYFGSVWEDHWVCEYWDRETRTWRLSDPQIDQMLRDILCLRENPKNRSAELQH